MVTIRDIREAVRGLGLSGRPLCIHSSLSSFGWVDGGPSTVIGGLLAEGCTIMVPTHSYTFEIRSPHDDWPTRREGGDNARCGLRPDVEHVYYPDSTEIDLESMGAIPAAVLGMPGHVRGNHPLDSFTAIGPLAHELICEQSPLNVYTPLKALAEAGGAVVMMGVGLDKMTLLHLAEQMAGRSLFRRRAYGLEQRHVEVVIGGCSSGFGNFEPLFTPLVTERRVGLSTWRAYPVRGVLEVAANGIREQPEITHCGNPGCHECNETLKSERNPSEKESA